MTAVRTVLSCLLVALSLGPARAADGAGMTKVGDLYRFCKAENDAPERLLCLGYISGMGDTMQVMALLPADIKDFAMCGEASYKAMVQAFVNWAEKHPERWEDPRGSGVMSALKELWPCK